MDLTTEKNRLRALIPRSIEEPLFDLKKILPEEAPKYQTVLLLESRLREMQRLEVQGVLPQVEMDRSRNLLRKNLLGLINELKEADFDPSCWNEANGIALAPQYPARPANSNRTFKMGWYALGLALLIVIGILLYPVLFPVSDTPATPANTSPIEEKDVNASETTTPDPSEQATLSKPMTEETSGETVNNDQRDTKPIEPTSEPAVFYTVKLVVNAANNDPAAWWVDNEPANVQNASLNVIEIRVQKKNSAHLFEWRKDNRSCRKQTLIEKDNQSVVISCN